MNKKIFFSKRSIVFLVLVITFLSLSFIQSDIVSVNPGGSPQHALTVEKFIEGFFFFHNFAPLVANVKLNATSANNLTTDNLTVYYSSLDLDGDALTNINDWRRNGNSLAVLNMPFDTIVSSTATGAVKDYSTYRNNGTLGGGNASRAPNWTSSGKLGGAYVFDGTNDYIQIAESISINLTQIGSVSLWFKPASAFSGAQASQQHIMSGKPKEFYFSSSSSKLHYFLSDDATGIGSDSGSWSASWYNVVVTSNGTTLKMYINSTLQSATVSLGSLTFFASGNYLSIGKSSSSFNGTIDDVQIFNRSLSPEQIKAMYQAGLENHSVAIIVSNETAKGDVWQVAVTPNDKYADGITVLSNTLTIAATVVSVNLTSPLNNWYSNDNILFECNASSDVNLKNSTIYSNYSGTWVSNLTNTSLSATRTSVLFNATGFTTESTFFWNCLFCDVENACNFSSSNRTLTTDLTKPLIDYVSPTNANATKKPSSENYSYVNVSSSDASNNFSVMTDWNRSLVGWWRLEQGNGTFFVDSSSYGNNGTCSGTTCPNLTMGVRGKAYNFDGSNDYINLSNWEAIRFDKSLNFSWSFWINPNTVAAGVHRSIFSEYSSANYKYIGLESSVAGGIRLDYGGSVDYTASIITSGVWQNLVLTHIANTTNYLIYVDGILKDTLVSTGSGVNTANKLIGVSTSNSFPFNGSIDDVQIYNRVFSPQEINASYQASLYKYYNNFTNLSSGTYRYTSYAFDQAGNLNNTDERYFILNNKPTGPTSVKLNATSANNLTTDNLTVYISGSSDADGDALTNITDWRKNGNSIAVLNMPFDTNISSTATGAVRDYSTYGNNGTLASGTSAPTWISNGKIGGAYSFDGANDYVNLSNTLDDDLPSVPATISVWVNGSFANGNQIVLGHFDSKIGLGFYVSGANYFIVRVGDTASPIYNVNAEYTNNQWHHIVVTYNSTFGTTFWLDGVQITTTGSPNYWTWTVDEMTIGRRSTGTYYNGTIDDVQIFNRSLSPEQIKAMYQAGLENHSVETMVSNETAKGDVWQVAVTPNDKYEDGVTVFSNNLTITTTSVSVNLTFPLNNWYSNNHILFECNASSDVNLKNSTLYSNYSGTWAANLTNTSLSGLRNSVLFNGTGFTTESTFFWNCLFCDVEHACNFSSSNRTLTTDLTKPLIDYVSPTNANATKKPSSENYSYVNVSSSDASNNFSVITDWNRSLVGWWRLEQGNGTFFVDSSSYGNNGTCTGATCPNLTMGVRGKAYNFDGANDYFQTGVAPSIPAGNSFTLIAWVNPAVSQGSNAKIVANYAIANLYATSGVSFAFLATNASGYQAISSGAYSGNQWHYLVGVYNGSLMSIYVNGVLKSTLNIGATSNAFGRWSNYLGIGRDYSDWTGYFNGSIDEVQIYNRALSAQEINASYQASLYKYYNNFTNLSSGTYKYLSYAFDQAGNVNNTDERYFILNNKPTGPTSVKLNATSANNLTTDNLTVYISGSSDADNDSLTNITDWRKNGNSIAVLNMPFDTNISSTATGAVKDYSTYGNNGTLASGTSAPTWISNGKIGGAYSFDGTNDYLTVAKSSSLNFSTEGFSISGWVYVNGEPNSAFPGFVEKGTGDWSDASSNQKGFFLSVTYNTAPARNIRFAVGNGSGYNYITPSVANEDLLGKWNHVVAVADSQSSSNPQLKVYMNGTLIGSTSRTYFGSIDYDKVLDIGRWSLGRYFNGSFDEVSIWNRSLSAEEVKSMYLDGLSNHSVETMVSNETAKGDVWQVAVTSNDKYEDGVTVLSNNLSIGNTAPTVSLYAPADGNVTQNRTPTFYWNGSDVDGDSLTYDLNITCYSSSGGGCTDGNKLISSISAQNYTLSPSDYLSYLKDNNYYYNWTVRAHDGLTYGAWATPVRKIEIQASVDLILINDTINFGTINMSESKNTTTNSPYPFSLQNNGNCFANVSMNATKLWNTIVSNSSYYQFKADNLTGEEGAFDWLKSLTSWNQMPMTGESVALVALNFNDSKDSAEVDVLVTVPDEEPAGDRQSTVYFTGRLGE